MLEATLQESRKNDYTGFGRKVKQTLHWIPDKKEIQVIYTVPGGKQFGEI